MKTGDKVRLIGIPPGLEDFPAYADVPALPTKSTFERCLGHEFIVSAIVEKERAELPIGSVTGNPKEKIYVDTKFLELISK
jgi:hypothetical protein